MVYFMNGLSRVELIFHTFNDLPKVKSLSTIMWHFSRISVLPSESSQVILHTTYRLGDTCYVSKRDRFGFVRQLLTINGGRYANLTLFEAHVIVDESGIPYSRDYSGETVIERLSRLSEPLVTAVEDGITWFVSANTRANFSWLDSHLLL